MSALPGELCALCHVARREPFARVGKAPLGGGTSTGRGGLKDTLSTEAP